MTQVWAAWRYLRRAWCEVSGGHVFGRPYGYKVRGQWVQMNLQCQRCNRILRVDVSDSPTTQA